MSQTRHSPTSSRDDQGVSAVIGVILMVAITVAIAATVYIWAGGFGETGEGPESASATAKTINLDDDNKAEWIKVTLTSGDNAPYEATEVTSQVAMSRGSFDTLCDTPDNSSAASDGDPGCGDPFTGADTWETGSAKWFPCQGPGANPHSLTLSVLDSTVLDRSIDCQEPA